MSHSVSRRLTEDDFILLQTRISRIGDMHLDFERQFGEFNNIIPYKYNWEVIEKIYSPHLYSLLQGIKSNIDGMFRILGEILNRKPQREKPTAYDYFEILDEKKMLGSQCLSLVEKPVTIRPFELVNNVPIWWIADNKTKHELPEGASEANYGNVIKALAGLVSLLQISKIALYRQGNQEILDHTNWHDKSEQFIDIFKRYEFETFTSNDTHWASREYLGSQLRKYHSTHFYYISDYYPPGNPPSVQT